MALILPFAARPARRRTSDAPTGGATIFLFTGVRYERHEDPSAPQDGKARGAASTGKAPAPKNRPRRHA